MKNNNTRLHSCLSAVQWYKHSSCIGHSLDWRVYGWKHGHFARLSFHWQLNRRYVYLIIGYSTEVEALLPPRILALKDKSKVGGDFWHDFR